MDTSQILTVAEVQTVVADLKRRAKRSVTSRLNLVVFRLACGCGLRRKEISGLNCGDMLIGGDKPVLRIRKAITKGREGKKKGRLVPLWWDKGTCDDLSDWLVYRRSQGAKNGDPFVCLLKKAAGRVSVQSISRKWRTAIRALPKDRVRRLNVHCGRHTFISHSLHVGHSLVSVRDAAGHLNVATTNGYLHLVEQDGVPDLYS